MNVLSQVRPPPPLHDLLGVSFEFNTKITALAWDRAFACFGLADGSVAILRANWEGAPQLRPRSGGGIEIAAGTAPPPPPAIFPVHKGEVFSMAADPLGGVVTGAEDGRLRRLHDGEISTMDEKPRRKIRAVAAGRGGRRAFAAGRNVDVLGPDAKRLTMPGPVTSLAYDPAGLHLAVGFAGGVSLQACGIRRNPEFQGGNFGVLAWDADGARLAAVDETGRLVLRNRAADDWEVVDGLAGPARAIAFAADGALVVAGSDFVQAIGPRGAQHVGRARHGAAPIACHPRLGLVACAGRDGAILLCRPGTADVMTIRDAGAAPIFLAFSPDGNALAFAADDGEAGTVILPDILFRIGDAR
jgi:hypothetical protein